MKEKHPAKKKEEKKKKDWSPKKIPQPKMQNTQWGDLRREIKKT